MPRVSISTLAFRVARQPLWSQLVLGGALVLGAVAARLGLNTVMGDRLELVTVWAVLVPLAWLLRPVAFWSCGLSGLALASYLVVWLDGASSVGEMAAMAVLSLVVMVGLGASASLARRALERAQQAHTAQVATATRLAAIVENSDDAIVGKNLDGTITSFNKGAERVFGYEAGEIIGKNVITLIPEDRRDEEKQIIARLVRGERVDHFDTVRQRKDRSPVEVSLTISPIRDESGKVVGASKIARDISGRKSMERELAMYREGLERQVAERTLALEQSHRQLREAERLTSLGTLSQGLGHDIGNLILPLRMRIDSLKSEALSASGRADLEAMEAPIQYIHNLARSLRLLALDPKDPDLSGAGRTDMSEWWGAGFPLFRAVLPRNCRLELRMGPLKRGQVVASMAPHQLTQAVFNLVQNAGEALASRPGPAVEVAVEAQADTVTVTVSDNGPGMTEGVRQRCLEPFFSTKARKLSGGLGLSVVRGLVEHAGGQVAVRSSEGQGAAFALTLPRVATGGPGGGGAVQGAAVSVKDRRLYAYVAWALRQAGVESRRLPDGEQPDRDIWVVEPELAGRAAEFARERGWSIVLGEQNGDGCVPRLLFAGARPSASDIRDAVRRMDGAEAKP